MKDNPLFIKTKQELLNWKKQKKYQGEKIPDLLKDHIKILLENYPRAQVTYELGLTTSNIFQQIPTKISDDKVSILRFEIEVPGKFTMRIFQ
jgi:hypothetical protein